MIHSTRRLHFAKLPGPVGCLPTALHALLPTGRHHVAALLAPVQGAPQVVLEVNDHSLPRNGNHPEKNGDFTMVYHGLTICKLQTVWFKQEE